ncbi:MAG TPA: glycoside hydrolase domain-containing protein, partial [Actinospica sp.]|nr:glycoside hydrolase domain-containing protein [Actinospica sp.]
MEKLSLARQTILGCLLAAALLSTLAAAGPARAGAARQPLQRHSGSRHSGPGRRRAAEHRPGAAEHRPVTAVVRRPTSAVPVRYEAAGVLPRMRVLTAPGFDTCSAPAASTMQAWYAESAYRAVGIYIGGRNRACLGGNLTSSWVSTVSAQGWGLFPVYVGLQAPCVIEKGMALMQSAQAAQEGAAEADDAATQAASYGLAKGSPVYFDLEA